MNILIIDSKTTRRHALQNSMLNLGFALPSIDGTTGGEDIRMRLENKKYSAIFIYAENTQYYHWEDVLEIVKLNENYDSIVLIALHDKPTKEIVIKSYEAGASGFLKSPCSDDDIKKSLSLLMGDDQ